MIKLSRQIGRRLETRSLEPRCIMPLRLRRTHSCCGSEESTNPCGH